MNPSTILLFGPSGQIGHELLRALAPLGSVITLGRPEIDFCRPESLRDAVRRHAPQIIVNAVAYTSVDRAESESDVAFRVNAEAPGVLAEEAERLYACFVHFSSDYVFDGRKSAPYVETDMTSPLSVYGRTKRDSERAVECCKKRLVFRTSWVVSARGHNFIRTILRLAGEREILRVVADQFGAPASAVFLADVTAAAVSQLAAAGPDDSRWGVYHAVPAGETNWFALAQYTVAEAAKLGMNLRAKPETIAPITSAEYPASAARPMNSRLDTAKLRANLGVATPHWKKGVDAVLKQLATDGLT